MTTSLQKTKCHSIPINKHFTCPYRQKLKPNGTKMINGVLNDIYMTTKCPECPYKKICAKKSKYRKLYEPASPAFIDEKIIFQSSEGKRLYKLRPIFSEGNFANLKSHQEFKKITKNRNRKSRYRLKTRSNSD